MDFKRAERKSGGYILLALLLFAVVFKYDTYLAGKLAMVDFTALHSFLDTLVIVVALSIAVHCWNIFPHTHSRYHLLLGLTFFTITALSIIHTAINAVEPDVIGGSMDKVAVWFAISAKVTEVTALNMIYIKQDTLTKPVYRKWLFWGCLIYLLALTLLLLYGYHLLPLLVDGYGLTLANKLLLIAVSFLYLTLAVLVIKRYRQQKDTHWLNLLVGVVLLLLAEIIPDFSQGSLEVDMLMGHCFKLGGYVFLFKSIYAKAVDTPFTLYKITEAKLKEAENGLESFFNLSPDIFCVLDYNGAIRQANAAFKNITGCTKEEFSGKAIDDTERNNITNTLQSFIASDSDYCYNVGLELRHESGKTIYTEWNMAKSKTDQLIYAIGRDVTEKRRTEEQLEQRLLLSKEQLNQLVIYNPAVIYSCQPDYNYGTTFITPNVKQQLGYEADEVVGAKAFWVTNIHPQDTRRVIAALNSLKTVQLAQVEYRFKHKDGHYVWLCDKMRYLTDEQGRPLTIIGCQLDVTKRKKAEQRLKSLTQELMRTEERERHNLATHLHDNIGQILAMAKLKLCLLKDDATSLPIICQLNKITRMLEEAIVFVRDLTFDLSPPPLYELGLGAAIESLAEKLQKDYPINFTIHSTLIVDLDQDMRLILYRAVRESFINIIKHAAATNVQVHMQYHNGFIEVVVRDDGVGFNVDRQFDDYQNRGYGIFNIQENFENIQGLMQVYSTVGQGTTVVLKAPYNIAAKECSND